MSKSYKEMMEEAITTQPKESELTEAKFDEIVKMMESVQSPTVMYYPKIEWQKHPIKRLKQWRYIRKLEK